MKLFRPLVPPPVPFRVLASTCTFDFGYNKYVLVSICIRALACQFCSEFQTDGETPKPHPESVELFRTMSKVKFGAKGLKYHMPDHGITVIIPENAVDAEAQICIGIYYTKPSQLPQGYRLVSEVFWIETSVHLQKCVELYIPHYVEIRNENDSKKLSFFVTSDESDTSSSVSDLAFVEVPTNRCAFEPGSCYGKVVLDHFCSGCILEDVDVDKLPLRYCITRILPNDSHSHTHKKWEADFVFSYAHPTCLKVCKYYTSQYFIYSNLHVCHR